ncbi:unnamed protein product [Mytilus coruscus]|uniref:TIR domain-containing protein n=1 Tax=Mytilus coruscus TaxID=42192 RepID=A0A6J8E4S9_MYTCO|nr:unnamed protein product [Mytilus coruscus]
MEYLDFSNNQMQSIPIIKDNGMVWNKALSVGIIDIRRNKINFLTTEVLDSFSSHKFVMVDIRENPFRCDCGTIGVFKYLSTKNMSKFYDYLRSLECASPLSVRGRKMSSLSISDLNCRKVTIINIPAIALSIVTIAIIISVVLIIYFRNLIKIILFTRLGIRFACNVSNYANEDRYYDAFIAYSEKDVDWVLHSAIPMLETGETGKTFRLCLHHRDFEIGETISNNIIKSVENSHHTILLISNDFLKSEWCMMEFRTALQKSLQDKNRHMILIMKDIVTTDYIDPDLKTCINCHTHLDIRDFLFWDKLKYAMSFRQ